jgi:hypothetical protein
MSDDAIHRKMIHSRGICSGNFLEIIMPNSLLSNKWLVVSIVFATALSVFSIKRGQAETLKVAYIPANQT